MNKILIFSGSSGSGKGTVLPLAMKLEPKLKLSVSMTTRAPREGEIDGVDYRFVSREVFDETVRADGFLEHAEFGGNSYGTPKKQFYDMIDEGFIPVLEIETDGAGQIMRKLEGFTSVFLSPPDYKTLEARLRGRCTEKESEILLRLKAAKDEILRSEMYEHVVINYDDRAEDAARAIVNLLHDKNYTDDTVVTDRDAFLASFRKTDL